MIYTIGHSTRLIEEFIALLGEQAVDLVVDVRRFPGSRRHPQFGAEALTAALAAVGVTRRHEEVLGGRRSPAPDSPNGYWRRAQFRGYADHLATPEARAAVERLVEEGAAHRLALLCAEAVPWRCHRQLVADALTARGLEVWHILSRGRLERHVLNPAARPGGDGVLVYPAP